MKNKNGFTLIEVIVVIAIIGILSLIILPAVLDIFRSAESDTVKAQERNIADAGVLFKKDFCDKPINSKYKKYCDVNEVDSKTLLKRINEDEYFICIDDLKILGYFEFEPKYNSSSCVGYVKFGLSQNGKYEDASTYFMCEDKYTTEGFKSSLYNKCYDRTLASNAKMELMK